MARTPFRITDMRVVGALAPQTGDTTAPTTPQNVVATAINAGRVDISWTASTDAFGVSGYQIFRNGSPLNTTTLTSYTDSTCQPSTLYSYVIVAFDAAGNNSAASNAGSATTPANAAPVWQSIPAQTLIVGNSYLLTLTSFCSDADLDTLTFTLTAGTLPTGVALSGTRLQGTPTTAGETPTVTVQAADQFHQIATTIAFSTKTADVTAPPVPTGLAAAAVSSSQVNVSWSASIDVAGSGNEFVSGTKDYRLYRDGSLRTTVNAPTTSYSDTGLAASTGYSYTITARDQQNNESAQSAAASATTQASTGLANGQTLTINGTGFGTKATAAPLLFDNFQSGSLGATIGTPAIGPHNWTPFTGGSATIYPIYSNAHSFGGSQSIFHDWYNDTNYDVSAYMDLGGPHKELFLSYRVYPEQLSDAGVSDPGGAYNWKFARLISNVQAYTTMPFGLTDDGSLYFYQGQSADEGFNWYHNALNALPRNQWNLIEQYVKLSVPTNTNSGKRFAKINGYGLYTWSGYPGPFNDPGNTGVSVNAYDGGVWNTHASDTDGTGYNWLVLPFFCRTLYKRRCWVAQVYVDTTQARVELRTQSTWSATDPSRILQPPTAWSNTQISVTLNLGTIASGATVYASVFTSTGTRVDIGAVGVAA
jgi:chitodextrinase